MDFWADFSHYSVTSVAWNNDNTKLASGSEDNTFKIWSVGSTASFKCLVTLGHSNDNSECTCKLTHKIDLECPATGHRSAPGAFTKFQMGAKLCLTCGESHSKTVTGVAFDPTNPDTLASCSKDGTIKIWNIYENQCVLTLNSNSNGYVSFLMKCTGEKSRSCVREINHLKRHLCVDKHMLGNCRNVKDFKMYVCECPQTKKKFPLPRHWGSGTGRVFSSFPFSFSVCWIGVLTSHNHRAVWPGIDMVTWNKCGTMLASSNQNDKTVNIWSVGLTGTLDCLLTLSGHRSAPVPVTSLRSQNLAC